MFVIRILSCFCRVQSFKRPRCNQLRYNLFQCFIKPSFSSHHYVRSRTDPAV